MPLSISCASSGRKPIGSTSSAMALEKTRWTLGSAREPGGLVARSRGVLRAGSTCLGLRRYRRRGSLEGSVSREHGDIDVLVDRKALSAHTASLEAIGYSAPQVYFEVVQGQPLVLGTDRDGMPVELGIYDEIEPGVASFVLPTASGLTRFDLPHDTLHHPITEIGGASVRTVSPLALFHLREAFIRSGVFGPPRDKDIATQAALRDRLLSGRTQEELRLHTAPA